MAIEKEINLNVKSNIEGSIGELKALKRELKGVDVGTEEFKKLFNQIDDLEDKIKSAKNDQYQSYILKASSKFRSDKFN